jgi:hypothetical protein
MLIWEYESFAFAFGLNCINKQVDKGENIWVGCARVGGISEQHKSDNVKH